MLVTCGHLFTILVGSNDKVVPNPSAGLQQVIDQGLKSYQCALDEIDVEIQLAEKYLQHKLKTVEKLKESSPITNQNANQEVSNAENNNQNKNGVNEPVNDDTGLGDLEFEDISAILRSVQDENNDFNQQNEIPDNTAQNDAEIGLFGDNFDFVLPTDFTSDLQ